MTMFAALMGLSVQVGNVGLLIVGPFFTYFCFGP